MRRKWLKTLKISVLERFNGLKKGGQAVFLFFFKTGKRVKKRGLKAVCPCYFQKELKVLPG
jgi:hypothetical protein